VLNLSRSFRKKLFADGVGICVSSGRFVSVFLTSGCGSCGVVTLVTYGCNRVPWADTEAKTHGDPNAASKSGVVASLDFLVPRAPVYCTYGRSLLSPVGNSTLTSWGNLFGARGPGSRAG
jgi:hypothetical protein